MAGSNPIYHLTTASELREGLNDGAYRPRRFAADRFVHCTTGSDTTLLVARDYFALARERLKARLVYEPPAPLAGGGSAHLASATVFPHVYGPINADAIEAVGVLSRQGDDFGWPATWSEPASVLAAYRA